MCFLLRESGVTCPPKVAFQSLAAQALGLLIFGDDMAPTAVEAMSFHVVFSAALDVGGEIAVDFVDPVAEFRQDFMDIRPRESMQGLRRGLAFEELANDLPPGDSALPAAAPAVRDARMYAITRAL